MKRLLSIVAAVIGLYAGNAAAAGSSTPANVDLQAVVNPACNITVPVGGYLINFGIYNPASPATGTVSVNFNCTKGTMPTGITIGTGLQPVGAQRYLKGPAVASDTIPYTIGGVLTNPVPPATNGKIDLTANILAGSWVAPDTYTDTVTLTVDF